MGDLMPDYDLERAQVDLEIAQHRLNIQASEFRKLQIFSEMKRIDENIAAAQKTIAEMEAQKNSTGPQKED